MKKYLFISLALIIAFFVFNKVNASETIKIPSEAIRIRIIPNSNLPEDQYIKQEVKKYVEDKIYTLLTDVISLSEAREIINNEINSIQEGIQSLLDEHNYPKSFQIKYGANYFPAKEYKGTTYDEGYYESLVIEIGEAKGDNWWCVLFPPLCMLEADESEEVEYKFFVQEMLSKIFNH